MNMTISLGKREKRQNKHDKFIGRDRANGQWKRISKLFPRATSRR